MPLLSPRRVKFRRMHRGHRRGKASGGTQVSFGEFGLQALESCWMTANQIESARIAMTRKIRRGGKIWIRIFPDKSYTKKPAETRMGSGKGAPEGWVAVIKPGRILFEMAGVSEELAKEAMRLASHKLPINVKFVTKKDLEATTTLKSATDAANAANAVIVDEGTNRVMDRSSAGDTQSPAEGQLTTEATQDAG